jgi:putative pyrroloquinoline-quinone-binding quinoprotein
MPYLDTSGRAFRIHGRPFGHEKKYVFYVIGDSRFSPSRVIALLFLQTCDLQVKGPQHPDPHIPVRWAVGLPDRIEAGAAYTPRGDAVAVGCFDGRVYCLDALSGRGMGSPFLFAQRFYSTTMYAQSDRKLHTACLLGDSFFSIGVHLFSLLCASELYVEETEDVVKCTPAVDPCTGLVWCAPLLATSRYCIGIVFSDAKFSRPKAHTTSVETQE